MEKPRRRSQGSSFHDSNDDDIKNYLAEGDGDDEDHTSEEDLQEEELIYSRGRSRSSSMIHNQIQPIPYMEMDSDSPSIFISGTNSSGSSNGTDDDNTYANEDDEDEGVIMDYNYNNNKIVDEDGRVDTARQEKVERTGPLQQREVLALKKGLEDATFLRNRDQILEEEEERQAAEHEKKSRTSLTQTQTAISSGPPTDARRVKLLMLGNSCVGKTSLIMRWTMDTFKPFLGGTVGVNFKSKKVMIDTENVQVQVWDTAGQSQFHKITTSYYRGANGIMLVYDISDKQSMEDVEYWVKNIKKHASDSVHVLLIGNKTDLRSADLEGKCTNQRHGQEVAEKFGIPYFETSAKESLNVDEAFMTIVRNIIVAETSSGGGVSVVPESLNARKSKSLSEKNSGAGILSSLNQRSKSMPVPKMSSSSASQPATDKSKCDIS